MDGIWDFLFEQYDRLDILTNSVAKIHWGKLHARKTGDGKYEQRLRKVEDEVRKKEKEKRAEEMQMLFNRFHEEN